MTSRLFPRAKPKKTGIGRGVFPALPKISEPKPISPELDEDTLLESMDRLYPDIAQRSRSAVDVLAEVNEFAQTNPEGFKQDVISKGRTPDTEAMLQGFGFQPEDIDELLPKRSAEESAEILRRGGVDETEIAKILLSEDVPYEEVMRVPDLIKGYLSPSGRSWSPLDEATDEIKQTWIPIFEEAWWLPTVEPPEVEPEERDPFWWVSAGPELLEDVPVFRDIGAWSMSPQGQAVQQVLGIVGIIGTLGFGSIQAATIGWNAFLRGTIARNLRAWGRAQGVEFTKETLNNFANTVMKDKILKRLAGREFVGSIFRRTPKGFQVSPEAVRRVEEELAALVRTQAGAIIPRATQTGAMAMGGLPAQPGALTAIVWNAMSVADKRAAAVRANLQESVGGKSFDRLTENERFALANVLPETAVDIEAATKLEADLRVQLEKAGFGARPIQPVPEAVAEAALPEGWRIEIGKIVVKPGMEEVVTGKAMVDWQNKVIRVRDADVMLDPTVMNEEIAHIRQEELPDDIKQAAISEYEVAAKYEPIEIRSQFARREGFGQDYGKYLTDPSSVTPEIAAVFEKYFPRVEPTPPTEVAEVTEGKMQLLDDKLVEEGIEPRLASRIARLLEPAPSNITPELAAEITSMRRAAAAPEVAEVPEKVSFSQEGIARLTDEQAIEMREAGLEVTEPFPLERQAVGEGGEIIPPDQPITKAVAENSKILRDAHAKEKFRPSRQVFRRMGLYRLHRGIQEAEVLIGETKNETNKQLKKVNKWVKKKRRVQVFREASNPGTVKDLTFDEKRAVAWFRQRYDEWADKLNLSTAKRIKNYMTNLFEAEMTKQLSEKGTIDAAIARALDYRTPKTIFNPFLQKRLGRTAGLIEDPFLAYSTYEAVQLRVYYYEPFLQKIAAIANDLNTPEGARDYLQDYSRRMTNKPANIDKGVNKDLFELGEKIAKIPGIGEFFAKYLQRGNPVGMVSYNLTSTLYTLWLGFKPTSAIRNISQHGLIIGEVGPIRFSEAISKTFMRESELAVRESLVMRSRRSSYVAGLEDSLIESAPEKFREVALFMFRQADKLNVRHAFLAGYYEAKHLLPNAPRQVWIDRGDEVAADTQYLYTKMNAMQISQSAPGRVFSMLTTWMENWMELMTKWVSRRPSQVYMEYESATGEKIPLDKAGNWSTSYRAILMYMAIVGLAYLIKEQTRLKAWEYTGFTSLNYLADIIGGDFPALEVPGAVADTVAGFVMGDEWRFNQGWNALQRVLTPGIIHQIENVASGERDWLTLFFYLEGQDFKINKLKGQWEKGWNSYPSLSDDKAKKKWRVDNWKLEAQMFISNRFTVLSSDEARAEVLRLIEQHGLDKNFIKGYEKVFGFDSTVELLQIQRTLGDEKPREEGEEVDYVDLGDFTSEVNKAVKNQGRDKVIRDGNELAIEYLESKDLFLQYEAIEPGEGRIQYRKQFADVEARLYLFGEITSLRNPDSAKILLDLMDKYDIPPQAIRAFKDKPEKYDELLGGATEETTPTGPGGIREFEGLLRSEAIGVEEGIIPTALPGIEQRQEERTEPQPPPPGLDIEEEFVPDPKLVERLIKEHGLTEQQANEVLSYSDYPGFTYQGKPLDTQQKVFELWDRMMKEFTPEEALGQLQEALDDWREGLRQEALSEEVIPKEGKSLTPEEISTLIDELGFTPEQAQDVSKYFQQSGNKWLDDTITGQELLHKIRKSSTSTEGWVTIMRAGLGPNPRWLFELGFTPTQVDKMMRLFTDEKTRDAAGYSYEGAWEDFIAEVVKLLKKGWTIKRVFEWSQQNLLKGPLLPPPEEPRPPFPPPAFKGSPIV